MSLTALFALCISKHSKTPQPSTQEDIIVSTSHSPALSKLFLSPLLKIATRAISSFTHSLSERCNDEVNGG